MATTSTVFACGHWAKGEPASCEQCRGVVTFTVSRTGWGSEWVAKFRVDGVRMPAWDVFESDKAAAVASGRATVRWAIDEANALIALMGGAK